ncbi:MAG: hypothetical protein ACREQD_16165 [Candidatus Binataceae bacterium]
MALEQALNGLMERQAEMRSGIQAAREQIFGDFRRSANVRLDNGMRHNRIVRAAALIGKHKFVEAVIDAGELALAVRSHQVDFVQPCRDVMIIPAIAPETHQILREAQNQSAGVVMRVAAKRFRRFLDAFQRKIARGKLAEHFFDALHFIARQQGTPELLQVNGRTKIVVEIADFVTREHVAEQVAFLKPPVQLFKQSLANLRVARTMAARCR